jgi:hypothetical protein
MLMLAGATRYGRPRKAGTGACPYINASPGTIAPVPLPFEIARLRLLESAI